MSFGTLNSEEKYRKMYNNNDEMIELHTGKDFSQSSSNASSTNNINDKKLRLYDKILIIILILACIGVLIIFIFIGGQKIVKYFSKFVDWWLTHKWKALGIIYIVYIVANIFIIPIRTIISVLCGFIYGLYIGLVFIWFSAVSGSIIAFLLGRSCCKDSIDRFVYVFCIKRCKSSNKAKEYDLYTELFEYLVKNEGFKTVLIVRLSIFPPSEWTNYIFANTKVPFIKYALATMIGRFFASASISVWIGSTLYDIKKIIDGEFPKKSTMKIIVVGCVYIISITLLIFMGFRAKKWLKGKEQEYSAAQKVEVMKNKRKMNKNKYKTYEINY